MAYHTSYMVYRDDLVLQQRTYSVIRNHLLEMMLLSEETRQRVSILEYIQDRTLLSRSSILNVLSALKKGGYIAFARGGYLQNIVSLPEKILTCTPPIIYCYLLQRGRCLNLNQ